MSVSGFDSSTTIRLHHVKNRSCDNIVRIMNRVAEQHGVTIVDHQVVLSDPSTHLSAMQAAESSYIDVFVFPVLSDERIPDVIEAAMLDNVFRTQSHIVCITGDFTTGEVPESRVSAEADRILCMHGSMRRGDPIIVDTPLHGDWEDCVAESFGALLTGTPERIAVVDTMRPPSSNRPTSRSGTGTSSIDRAEAALHVLCTMLPAMPAWNNDDRGRCRSLRLTDGHAYPRSLLNGLTKAELATAFDAIAHLDHLEALSLDFAGLTTLPGPLPASLQSLNLTGNPLQDWEPLTKLPKLHELNLAACDLRCVPEVLRELPLLDTLILAKNRLPEVPSWFAELQSLERLTFYRNMLTRLDRPLTRLRALRILNIGASPLEDLGDTFDGLEQLQALGVCMTRITSIPEQLFDLPRLEAVDVSKNPQLDLSTLPDRARDRLVVAMPSWNRFAPSRAAREVRTTTHSH